MTSWIIGIVSGILFVGYMLVVAYGLGLREGRREGIADAKLWRQPQ